MDSAPICGRAPIVGPRTVDQLAEDLAAVDLVLAADAVQRLESAIPVERGFPADFLCECDACPFVYRVAAGKVDTPRWRESE